MFALHKAFQQSTQSVHDAARAERERRNKLPKDGSRPSSEATPSQGSTRTGRHRTEKSASTDEHDSPIIRSEVSGSVDMSHPAPQIRLDSNLQHHQLPSTGTPQSSQARNAQASGYSHRLAPLATASQDLAGSVQDGAFRPRAREGHHGLRSPQLPRSPQPDSHHAPVLQPLVPPPVGNLPPIPLDQAPLPSTPRVEGWVPPPGSIVRTPRRRSSKQSSSQPNSPPMTVPSTPASISSHSLTGGADKRHPAQSAVNSLWTSTKADGGPSNQTSPMSDAAPRMCSENATGSNVSLVDARDSNEMPSSTSKSTWPARSSGESLLDPSIARQTPSIYVRVHKPLSRSVKRDSESRGSEASSVALGSSPEGMDPGRFAHRPVFKSVSGEKQSLEMSAPLAHEAGQIVSGHRKRSEDSSTSDRRLLPLQTFSALSRSNLSSKNDTTSVDGDLSPGSSLKRRSLSFLAPAISTGGSGDAVESVPPTLVDSRTSSRTASSREHLELSDALAGGTPNVHSGSSSAIFETSPPRSSRETGSTSARPSVEQRDLSLDRLKGSAEQSSAAADRSGWRRINRLDLFGNSAFDPFAREGPKKWTTPAEIIVSPGTVPQSDSYMTVRRENLRDGDKPIIRSRSSNTLKEDYQRNLDANPADEVRSKRDSAAIRPGSASTVVDSRTPERSNAPSRLMRSLSNRRPRTSGGDSLLNSPTSPRRSESRTGSNDRPSTAVITSASPIGPDPAPTSRLEITGGAAALFGGGSSNGSRPRASSLLPNLSMFGNGGGRARTNSSAGRESPAQRRPGSRNGVAHLVAQLGGGPPPSGLSTKSARAATSSVDNASQADSVSAPAPRNVSAPVSSSTTGPPKESQLQTGPPKTQLKYPPLAEETPDTYAARIDQTVERSEVATVLASSPENFFSEALRCYMRKFLFVGNALDIALRKMLMELRLPKETQQIDRVMEAFAKRYNECNEGLFASEDQPYILAFSLMMLHTDAFNRNAKNKMSKADYVKNTSSSGVPQDVLEYLYDNLTFTQFVYSDEAQSVNNRPGGSISGNGSSGGGGASGFFASMTSGSSGSKDKNNRVDAYLIIRQGRLSQLCPNIDNVIPEDDPFSYTGTDTAFDIPGLARAYMSAPSIEIVATRRPSLGSGAGMGDVLVPSAGSSQNWVGTEGPTGQNGLTVLDPDATVTLRVFKVGIINRKDEITEKGKKNSRKWKSCGMILSSSQLLFFRDLVWIDALQTQIGEQLAAAPPDERKKGIVITPRITNFRPDGVLSLGDAIALKDDSYDRHQSVLRLVGVQGTSQHEYLFQARDDTDMNEWIAGINFCACFRAAGIRVTNLDALALCNAFGTSFSPPGHSPGSARPSMSRSASSNVGVDTPWTALDALQQGNAEASSHLQQLPSSPNDLVQMLRDKVASRRRELTPKLEKVMQDLESYALELQELLRLARQFALMTPFQRTTRERIEAAAAPLAARIRQLRIAVAKFECRYHILEAEMTTSERAAWPGGTAAGQDTASLLALAQQERKGSYFVPESPGAGAEFGQGPLGTAQRQDSLTSSLRPVSEASENDAVIGPLTPVSPHGGSVTPYGVSIGSFASPHPDLPVNSKMAGLGLSSGGGDGEGSLFAAAQSSSSSSSARSIRLKVRTKSKGASETGSRGEVAESWNSTRAFRDPDRISVAQLPSIETIEAATREKARRRINNGQNQLSKRSVLMYNASGVGGGSSGPIGPVTRGSVGETGGSSSRGTRSVTGGGTSASSSSRRGGGSSALGGGYSGVSSSGSGSGRGEIPVQDRALDPPVFMSTWGA